MSLIATLLTNQTDSLSVLCIYFGMSREFVCYLPDCYFLHSVSDIDYCITVACKNGGSCLDGLDKYVCSCAAGFSGDHCETGIHI